MFLLQGKKGNNNLFVYFLTVLLCISGYFSAGVFLMEFGGAVAEVETHHVEAANADHVFEQLHIVAAGAQCGHDFGVVTDAGQVAFGAHCGVPFNLLRGFSEWRDCNPI